MISDTSFIPYCLILKHSYNNKNCEHFDLLIINSFTFDINNINQLEEANNNISDENKECIKNPNNSFSSSSSLQTPFSF